MSNVRLRQVTRSLEEGRSTLTYSRSKTFDSGRLTKKKDQILCTFIDPQRRTSTDCRHRRVIQFYYSSCVLNAVTGTTGEGGGPLSNNLPYRPASGATCVPVTSRRPYEPRVVLADVISPLQIPPGATPFPFLPR